MHRSLQSIFFRQNAACTLSLTNDSGVKKETISPGPLYTLARGSIRCCVIGETSFLFRFSDQRYN